MALNLSKAKREELEKLLAAAEPYPEDSLEVNGLHVERDFARFNATMAKRFLEQDDREKAAAKQQKE